MKLTTKGTYGLRAAFELARAYGENPIPLKDIAQSQELAEKYLEQLLALLKRPALCKPSEAPQADTFYRPLQTVLR